MIRFTTFILLLISLQAHAWVIESNFDSGAIGAKADGDDGFRGGAYKATVYSNERAHSGSQSAKSTIRKGHDGFSEWGGVWDLPTKLGEGDEIWYRVWVYYPPGFSFSCGCPEGIKFMRTRTVSASGTFEGSWDYYLRSGGVVMATGVNAKQFYAAYEPSEIREIGDPITTGIWHVYEHYIKFSATAGKGIIRAWQDGKLVFEDKMIPTLTSSTSKAAQVSLWTYWNNTAPATQSAYVDDVLITDEVPGNKDIHGNSFIGTGGASFLARPKPPTVNLVTK